MKRTEFHQIRVEDGKKLLSLIIQIEPIRRRPFAAAKFLSKSNTISVGERNAQNQGQGKMARKTGKTERKPKKKSEGLVAQYHAIGPASLIAALLCAPRSRIAAASRRPKTA